VENRIPSSDANPYLALAASLACGLIGMVKKIECDAPILTTANEAEIDLPRGLLEAVDLFESDEELGEMLGTAFVSTYAAIKKAEFETFMEVISPWEREYLLLNV
jgi:glutamine synthetase